MLFRSAAKTTQSDSWEEQTKFMERFAALLVGECLTQVDKVDAMLDDPKEKLGVSWVGLAIAKHFGVEE